MLLKDACTPDVVCCTGDTSALDAARIMRHKHIGAVVVVDNPDEGRIPLGIVTDRDIVVEVLGQGLDPSSTSLTSLMHTPVVIAHESEDTGSLVERMRAHGVRRVPVVNHTGALVGIMTLDDLLKILVFDVSALTEITDKGRRREQHQSR